MSNNWWEIEILSDPALEDLIFWRLDKFGCRGMSSEMKGLSSLVRAYIPGMEAQLLDLAALSLWLRQDALTVGQPSPLTQWHLIDEEDWASSWKQYWQPQKVGDRLLIHPAWLPVPEECDRLILHLDPGVAFGTGTHQTTQLCLESLEMRLGTDVTDVIVGDIGCGSGILSTAAVLLGAKKVYAVDTDPLAVRASISNRELNQIDPDRLLVEKGSIDCLMEMLEEPVDGFVCNILAETIIELIPQMEAISKPTAWGVLSGILLEQVNAVADTLDQNGWAVATLWRRQDWCCLNIRRSS